MLSVCSHPDNHYTNAQGRSARTGLALHELGSPMSGDTSVMWLQHTTLVVFISTLSSLVPSAGLCALPFNNSLWYLSALSPHPFPPPPSPLPLSTCSIKAADAVSSNLLLFPPPLYWPFVPTHQDSDPAQMMLSMCKHQARYWCRQRAQAGTCCC